MPPVLRVAQVSKRFGDFEAVDCVSFEVEQGTFVTLLGPSGCGKTTTLRMIGGFETPDEGAVFLDDKDITDLPPHERDVNTVFQDYALFPHMTVFQNVAFGLEAKRLRRTEIESRVTEALAMVKLADFRGRTIQGLSGGERQRVALARAFAVRPTVLLLDEPLGALDLKLRKQMQIELKSLQRALDIAFVYVTHDQDEALSMSDHIIVMNEGRIEQTGSPQAIYTGPETAFAATFLGDANILSARVVAGTKSAGAPVSAELAGEIVTAAKTSERCLDAGEKILLAVRAESIALGAAADATSNRVTAHVEGAVYFGSSWEYTLRLRDGHIITARATAQAGRPGLAIGDQVVAGWDAADTVVVRQ